MLIGTGIFFILPSYIYVQQLCSLTRRNKELTGNKSGTKRMAKPCVAGHCEAFQDIVYI